MLHLEPRSYDWALAHALRFRDTDVLPMPFEFDAIEHDWTSIRDYLVGVDVLSWTVRPHRSLLAPKAHYGFRVVTQLDPLDFLVFAAIIHDIANDIEAHRVSLARQTAFSYRVEIKSDGQLYSPHIGYPDFQARVEELLASHDNWTHVAVADIADFYHRIYSHRLKGALEVASKRNNHIKAIKGLISGWNGTETFGIPVGNQPSRLLAEAVLRDVDEAMLGNEIAFTRFNDDYRILARNHPEAYRHLAYLAQVLWTNHGLTLQPHKTTVLTREQYRVRFTTPEEREVDSLYSRFAAIAEQLGLDNWYEPIDYDELDEAQKAAVDSLNVEELLREEMAETAPDFAIIKFLLRRLSQLGDSSVADEVVSALEQLYPVFPDIVEYLANLKDLSPARRRRIGGKIRAGLENSILSELEYHRMWGLDLFAGSTQWGQREHLLPMLANARDPLSRRKLILAMGRSHQRHWFQGQWRNLFNESPWPKRALIAAASCLPPDPRKHWYKSIEPRLDVLERAVMRWAKDNPF